jgi:hypothetical protein
MSKTKPLQYFVAAFTLSTALAMGATVAKAYQLAGTSGLASGFR